MIWDDPARQTPDDWVISDNGFRNFYRDDGAHSQTLFIGFSTNGLIKGNTFVNNGNTSHIFFSWYGAKAEPWVSYPSDICVGGTGSARCTVPTTTSTSVPRCRSRRRTS